MSPRFFQIQARNEVPGSAGAACKGNGLSAQIPDRAIGFFREAKPEAGVFPLPIDLADQQEFRRIALAGMDHVGRAEPTEVDRTVRQSLDDHRRREGHDHANFAAKDFREGFRERLPLRQHGIGVFVRLERHDNRLGQGTRAKVTHGPHEEDRHKAQAASKQAHQLMRMHLIPNLPSFRMRNLTAGRFCAGGEKGGPP